MSAGFPMLFLLVIVAGGAVVLGVLAILGFLWYRKSHGPRQGFPVEPPRRNGPR